MLNPRFYNKNLFVIILWVLFFCYAICAALAFQKIILPLMPNMLAPGSSLTPDSAYFDAIAAALASDIREVGWSAWNPFPGGTSLNVAFLGGLYALFGHDPSLAIPLNAAFHAFGGILIFMLTIELSPSKLIGRYAGIIAATLFIVFPSALNWYGQIHKDGYFIVGVLLTLLMWVKAIHGSGGYKFWLQLTLGSVVGIALVAFMRPYTLKILFWGVLGVLVAMLVRRVFARNKASWLFFMFVLVTLGVGQKLVTASGVNTNKMGMAYSQWQQDGWEWRESSLVPGLLESQIRTVAATRAGLIHYGNSVQAKSLIDADVMPESTGEVITYLPRAFQIALLAPFPTSWLDRLSLTKLVSAGEMLVTYLCLSGLFFVWRYNRSPAVLLSVFFSSSFLIVYGFTIANIGTLYRVRYGYEFVMILLGIIGWVTYLDKKGMLVKATSFFKARTNTPTYHVEAKEGKAQLNRKGVFGAGALVMGLTLLGFVGFFLRDVLMAQTFGLGAELDSFFLALMIPMFIITVFCMSLGSAFIPFYTGVQQRLALKSKNIVSHVSANVLGVLAVICLLLYFGEAYILTRLDLNLTTQNIAGVSNLTGYTSLILLFGGIVILGNATLSATQRIVLPSLVQLVVPIAAIAALILFGKQYGVVAVMAGMLVGQLANLLIVQFFLKKAGISLVPKYQKKVASSVHPLWKQYTPLLASAFFIGVALPINTMLAATLPGGGVSAFNLGSKVVIFVSGLIGAVISSVMLPYFSSLVARKHLVEAQRELSAFLLMITFITVPTSVVLYIWSEPIVRMLFERGTFSSSDVRVVAQVMQYAVIQLPFFASNILLLKYATATRHTMIITFTALFGLLMNIGLSLIFMSKMGVAGIALAASISMLVSSALLLLALFHFGHITLLDSVIVLLNWTLFVTLVIALHFMSTPSTVLIIATYLFLLIAYSVDLFLGKKVGWRY